MVGSCFVDEHFVSVSDATLIKVGRKMVDFLLDDRLAGESVLNLSEERGMLLYFSERCRRRYGVFVRDGVQGVFSFSCHASRKRCEEREEEIAHNLFLLICDAVDAEYADRFASRRVYLQILHHIVYVLGVPRWGKPT
ncbi:MAG: hypothetical protein OYG31_03185 [Candidatus Kaiserbacteria bacterium]|nr:hypothetical protein [Candidatus Kaiserbacteria bacterium]